jgi:hypothetical protein
MSGTHPSLPVPLVTDPNPLGAHPALVRVTVIAPSDLDRIRAAARRRSQRAVRATLFHPVAVARSSRKTSHSTWSARKRSGFNCFKKALYYRGYGIDLLNWAGYTKDTRFRRDIEALCRPRGWESDRKRRGMDDRRPIVFTV